MVTLCRTTSLSSSGIMVTPKIEMPSTCLFLVLANLPLLYGCEGIKSFRCCRRLRSVGFAQGSDRDRSMKAAPQHRYIALVSQKFIHLTVKMNFMETRKSYTCKSCGYRSRFPLSAEERADCRRMRRKRRMMRGMAIALAILAGTLAACLIA